MFKMTHAGLVKKIRNPKLVPPGGWHEIRVGKKTYRFHRLTVEGAKMLGCNEVWARFGEDYGPGFKEFRGTAERVAQEILDLEPLTKNLLPAADSTHS